MFRTVLFASAACLALSACADGGVGGTNLSGVPETEAEKSAMATELANMMTDPAMLDQMFSPESMAAAIPDMSAMCAAVPADQAVACTQRMEGSKATIQSVQTEMMDKAKAMTPQLMADMGGIMARTYTGEELSTMHAFYSSPEGQSILKKQPQVMAEFMPIVLQRLQPLQLEMVQKLSQRMTADATGALPPGTVTTTTTTVPGAAPVATTAPVVPGTVTTQQVTPTPAPAAPVTPAPTTTSPTLPRP